MLRYIKFSYNISSQFYYTSYFSEILSVKRTLILIFLMKFTTNRLNDLTRFEHQCCVSHENCYYPQRIKTIIKQPPAYRETAYDLDILR